MVSPADSGNGETASGDLLDAALAYAKNGLPVLPLNGKIPRTANGLKDASTDADVIAAWWRSWPDANVGIRTGTESGIVVLDVDPRHGGTASLLALKKKHGRLSRGPQVLTGGGGAHIYFRHPGGELRNSAGQLGDGLDIRSDGGYVVAPPSLHESGNRYRWLHEFDRATLADPGVLFADTVRRRNGDPAKVAELIPEGKRRQAMLTVAGKLKRAGLTGTEILPTLRELNLRCQPPLEESELESVAFKSTIEPDPASAIRTAPTVDPCALDDVVETFRRWLSLPDPTPIYVVLATLLANRMSAGDPVWLVVVGGSSRGKTELLNGLVHLDGVRIIGGLTKAAFLSGTPKKDQAKTASGGILRDLPESGGVLCIKDFGAILSMRRDDRQEVLQALRDIYDGRYTRDVGAGGGERLEWTGRVGLVAAATGELDRAHAVLSVLGERWLTVRLQDGDTAAIARRSLLQYDVQTMRDELARAVLGYLKTLEQPQLRAVNEQDEKWLVALAVLVANARSPVARDAYGNREIELVPQGEGPGRIVRQLHKLLVACQDGLGLDRATLGATLTRVALDSIPSPRRETLEVLLAHDADLSTAQAAVQLGLPRTTAERALEDLTALGLVSRSKADDENDRSSNLWRATTETRERFAAANAR